MRPYSRLANRFDPPAEHVRRKLHAHLDGWIQTFIGYSPLVILTTCDGAGFSTASPRGGDPGFVQILDEKTLFIPDLPGNNLFQSFSNIDSFPYVGLLFLVPGLEETARVSGRAEIVADREPANSGVARPVKWEPSWRQGLLVHVASAYGHCGRALRLAGIWDQDRIEHFRQRRAELRRPRD